MTNPLGMAASESILSRGMVLKYDIIISRCRAGRFDYGLFLCEEGVESPFNRKGSVSQI